jgi:pimeloyl-ACP methyl ester carboxylesterase
MILVLYYRYENAKEYFVHGEDWGSFITTTLAELFPNRVRGIHITNSLSNEYSSLIDFSTYLLGAVFPTTLYTQKEIELKFPERYSFSNRLWTFWSALGYFHLQVIIN